MKQKLKPLLPKLAVPVWLLALLCLDLLFRKTYGYVGGVSWRNPVPLLFTLLWLLFFGALALLLPRWGGRTVILLTTVLSCLLTVVHAVMYQLFGNFFGLSDLLYAGDGAAFFSFRYVHMRLLLLAGVLLTLAAGVTAAVLLPKPPQKALADSPLPGGAAAERGGPVLAQQQADGAHRLLGRDGLGYRPAHP